MKFTGEQHIFELCDILQSCRGVQELHLCSTSELWKMRFWLDTLRIWNSQLVGNHEDLLLLDPRCPPFVHLRETTRARRMSNEVVDLQKGQRGCTINTSWLCHMTTTSTGPVAVNIPVLRRKAFWHLPLVLPNGLELCGPRSAHRHSAPAARFWPGGLPGPEEACDWDLASPGQSSGSVLYYRW